ncbi:class I SAM-dependent rRNA methyltransferase [Leptospira adleri]|uniref:SAM-dependent methyltransferase n=1 Tax=Leptospira adleri TaxID=2023186 RepID=A0A2M9YIL2_9LEPT|nr:class I SAM-dependent methyltransferase [Leptospira adleri]PJZ51382.1 SAM-dependent methyltransferase [Leptospira adleri]PJZ60444.1 SAM-dependent methyltransferase [Leptospira adleri]
MNRKSELSVKRKHPWIFSGNLSSAATPFVNGEWLTLFSTENRPIATGIYSKNGLIRIRVIQNLPEFSKEKIRENLISALHKRKEVRKTTNAYRILHGENDLFPGVTVDKIGGTWVVRIYSSSLIVYGRWIVWNLYDLCRNSKLGESLPSRIILDPPEKTGGDDKVSERIWRGAKQGKGGTSIIVRETVTLQNVKFPVELPGQKGGIFLDLRNRRKFLLERKEISKGKDCLHLFSHTGLTSICMDAAGARSVTSVDGSKEALDSFQRVLSLKKDGSSCKHRFVQKNLFRELEDVLKDQKFGLIVIDPPNLTPDAKSKKNALKTYSHLFASSLTSLQESGTIILCSCSGRIASQELESLAKNILRSHGWKYERFESLKPEDDHPVRSQFPEGNYFKVHIYENCKTS